MFIGAKLNSTQRLAVATGSSFALLLVVLSAVFGGRYGLEGSFVGLLLGIWTVGTLGFLAYNLIRDRLQPSRGVFLTLMVAILKLPVTLLFLYVGATLPTPGLGCFLAGLGLVYYCSVWFLMGAARE